MACAVATEVFRADEAKDQAGVACRSTNLRPGVGPTLLARRQLP
jgi:hypothetical protein